jgi:hypothetical protein
MKEQTLVAMYNRRGRRRGLVFIAGAMLVQSGLAHGASILKDSFDTGAIQSEIWNPSDTDGCSASIQSGAASEGKQFLRSSLTAAPDGGNYRCELRAKNIDIPANGFVKEGDTVYYGISYRIPSATLYDPLAVDTLTQWFQNPAIGGGGCHQVIQLKENLLKWHNHNCGGVGGEDAPLLASVPKDTWIRVCKKAKWTTADDGEIKVWVNPASENSTPAKNYSGRTLIDGWTNLVMFKIGLYKPKWRTGSPPSNMSAMSPRIFEHDDIRVAASFAEACGGSDVEYVAAPEPPVAVAVE